MKTDTIHRSGVLLALVLSLISAIPAQATLQVSEDAFELNAAQIVRWPLRAGDSLVIRPCSECGIESLRVTEQTRYATGFGASTISLNHLLRQKLRLRDGTPHVIVVFFNPDERRITRLILQTEFE